MQSAYGYPRGDYTLSQTWAFQQGVLWVLDLEHHHVSPVQPRIDADFTEVSAQQADNLAAAMGRADRSSVLQRLESGKRCFAGWVAGKIATYCWVSFEREVIGEMEHELRLLKVEAYIWDCATLPNFRRNRLYSALLSDMVRMLAVEGFQRIWIGSNLENKASLLGFEKAGFQPIIELAYLRMFNLRLFWLSPYSSAPQTLIQAARRALTPQGGSWLGRLLVRIS